MKMYYLGYENNKSDLSLLVVFFSYRIPTSTKMPPEGSKQNTTKHVINRKQDYQPLHCEVLAILAETFALLEYAV